MQANSVRVYEPFLVALVEALAAGEQLDAAVDGPAGDERSAEPIRAQRTDCDGKDANHVGPRAG